MGDRVQRAQALGLATKLNVVVQRGLNDDELPGFLAWSRSTGIEVRFIELMNTGSASEFTRARFVAGAEVVSRLGATRVGRKNAADPACLFRADDGTVFGLIASDTAPFCQDCARLRLSADGQLRGCLYEPDGAPLVGLLREGASDATLRAVMQRNVAAKQSHHPSLAVPRGQFSMADLGG